MPSLSFAFVVITESMGPIACEVNMQARITKAAVALAVGLSLSSVSAVRAEETKREVDQEVQTTLQRFRTHVDAAPEVLEDAKAVLVVPDVKKVGLVGGGEWGEGALRKGGKTIAYYKMRGGSVGLQAGYEEGDMVFVFFTDEALNKFMKKNEFDVEAEAGVTMVDKDANASANTIRQQGEVAGFAFNDKGLMAGATVKGTKFKRVHPK
jgi:lipid-binding SYLF domain-containing protein